MRKLLLAAVLLLLIHELKHKLDDDALKSFLNDYEEKIMPLASEHFPDI